MPIKLADLSTAAALAMPLALVCAGTAAGLVLRRFLTRRLEKERVRPGTHVVLLTALKGPVVLWTTTLGLYVAAQLAELPPGLARVVPNVLLVMLLASLTWASARLAAGLVGAHDVIGSLPAATLFGNVVRMGVLAIGFLVILQTLGISITPLITALGVGGLAVALALQDTLANLFAGVYLLASKQVRPGDFVRIDTGQEGYVQDVTWRFTSIRQIPNNIVVIPNAKLASAITTNYNRPSAPLTFGVRVSVGAETDLDRVERVSLAVATEVLREVPGGVADFTPHVRYNAFGRERVRFDVVLKAQEFVAQGLLRHELIKRLHQRFRGAGISLKSETAHESRPLREPA